MSRDDLEIFTREEFVALAAEVIAAAAPGVRQALYQGRDVRRRAAARMLASAVSERMTFVEMWARPRIMEDQGRYISAYAVCRDTPD